MLDPRPRRSSLENGLRLLEEGDIPSAIEAMSRAARAWDADAVAAVDLLPTWAEALPWTQAAEGLQRLLSRAPTASGWRALGELLLASGRPLDAMDAFEAARTEGDEEGAQAGLARAMLDLGRADAALALLADLGPSSTPNLRILRAQALDRDHRGREADRAWKQLADTGEDGGAIRRPEVFLAAARARLADDPSRETDRRALHRARALVREGRTEEARPIAEGLARTVVVPSSVWHVLTRVRLAQGDTKSALQALEHALAQPASPRTQAALADAMADAGHAEAADRMLQVAASPDADLLVRAVAAAALVRLGRAGDALSLIEAVLDEDETWLPSRLDLARALTALGRAEEGRSAWKRVLELSPGHPEAIRGLDATKPGGEPGRTERGVARIHHDLGRSLLHRARYREAASAFRSALEVRPDWSEPWRMLGSAYLHLDEPTAALDAFRHALEHDPADGEAAWRLGELYREQGALPQAIAALDRTLELQPAHLKARAARGEARRLSGQFGPAAEDFEAVLKQVPEDRYSLVGLAAALNGLKRFAEARAIWLRAREQEPENALVTKGLAQSNGALRGAPPVAFEDVAREARPAPSAAKGDATDEESHYEAMDHVDRGRSHHKDRNYVAAIEAFKRALEIDPTCHEAALRLGMAFEDDRQFRKAISAYRTTLEIEPNHYQAATNIGEAYRKNEQYREAMVAYEQALGMKPEYLYALAGKAECHRMLGRYEEALLWFDRALASGPNHAFALQGKAASLNALQRYEEAHPWWRRAVELEPHSQFAQDGKTFCEAQLDSHEPPGTELPLSEDVEVDAESTTPTLDEQGRDLTELAREGKLPRVIGRDAEIRRVMKTLVRRLKANPILLGEPGVGKTAIVEGLAQALLLPDVPARLQGLRIVELSMGSLIAGTKYRGTFEERLREILKEASSEPGLVLFIDEIHTLVGAGRTEGGSLDAANILKPALARGEITVIGATTLAEYRRYFENDAALERRFQPITIEEPTAQAAIGLLSDVASLYEKHHGVKVAPDALAACVHLAIRFLPDRRLPDKALDLLDEACSEAHLEGIRVVDAEVVARVVAERTKVPVTRLTEAERGRLDSLESLLGARVVGQTEAVHTLSQAVRLSKAGLRSDHRPRGVFMFRGASGVGKTELAKALADFLFPEGDALVRLDMSEYADRFTVSRLLGAPPGYSGHGEDGQLTGPLRRKPYCVLLLDEFEKAHPDVQAVFLALMEEGEITDSDGRKVSAREAFIVLTTNAGTELRAGARMGFGSAGGMDAEALRRALEPYFRPELLDRVDDVVSFADLDLEALHPIATQRLQDVVDRAASRGLAVQWTPPVVDLVLARRKPGDRGARSVLRAVDVLVGEPLGRLMLALSPDARRSVTVRVVDGELRLDDRPMDVPNPGQGAVEPV